MDFLKKIFNEDATKPIANIPGIEPIVVQAVESLFPDTNTQKNAFNAILEVTKERKNVADPKTLLALLHYSNGDLEKFRKSAWQSHPHFWMDEIGHIFRTMEDAEEWVKSLSKSQH
jgi:hypothetical protein